MKCQIKLFYYVLFLAIISFSLFSCDNGNNNENTSNGNDNDNYIEGKYSGFTVTSTSSGQITFQVMQVTANFTTNIPNNTRFSLGIDQQFKMISGLPPNKTYNFSFTYNANIHISLQVDNGRVVVGRGWY